MNEDHIRPWGRYDILDEGIGYKVKRITVSPACRLSYQRHAQRSECWTIVAGRGRLTLDDVESDKSVGDVVKVGIGTKHRIQNIGTEPLIFIEVQLGAYLGEDDIERFSDDYGRVGLS